MHHQKVNTQTPCGAPGRAGRLATALIGLLLSGIAHASAAPRCPPWQSFARPGIFWSLQGPNGAPHSHLLGTMHLDRASVLSVAPAVEPILRKASVFVMETLLTHHAIATLRHAMRLPAGGNLKSLIGHALYARAQNEFKHRGWPLSALADEQPWALLITLSVPPMSHPVLDQVLAQHARRRDIPVVGLESTDEQIEALSTLPLAVQRSLLREALDHPDGQALRTLAGQYHAQNLNGLVHVANERDARHPRTSRLFFRRLLHDRNRRMIARLLPILAHQRAFVAVGALHLPGFLSRLNRAGYCARPITLREP
ncbi:MAG: TraB/GumN family protein [Acidiferrobacteraceae bacterium]